MPSERRWYQEQEECFGTILRNERRARGWSQADMARKLNEVGWPLHQTTVSKIEAGKHPLRVADLYAFAHALGVPVAAFLYVPAVEESPTIQKQRERLRAAHKAVDEAHEKLTADLAASAGIYALMVSQRDRLVREIGEAAMHEQPSERAKGTR